jgi:HAE1 family hydrophobic/amphiphilic exporter-1
MTDLRKRPEYSVKVDRRAAVYGLTVKKVADSLHAQIRGMRPTEFHELAKGERVEMITRLQPIYRQKIDDLKLIPVGTEEGVQVPLQEVANLYPSVGPQTIDRKNKYRYVFVKADIKRPVEEVAKEVEKVLSGIKMPDDYFWRFGGGYDDLMASKSQLFWAVLITIMLVYMTMACLFQDFLSPLLIMVTVPMALIGVWIVLDWPNLIRWPLSWMGLPVANWTWIPSPKPLSQQVLIGIVMLSGYVVSAAIIMMDHYKSLLAEGHEIKEALVQSVTDRFRPILMTTLTTVLGFSPMAFSIGTSSDLWAPMALTGIGGMVMGTVLTLFVLPILIYFVNEIKGAKGLRFFFDHYLRPVGGRIFAAGRS